MYDKVQIISEGFKRESGILNSKEHYMRNLPLHELENDFIFNGIEVYRKVYS